MLLPPEGDATSRLRGNESHWTAPLEFSRGLPTTSSYLVRTYHGLS